MTARTPGPWHVRRAYGEDDYEILATVDGTQVYVAIVLAKNLTYPRIDLPAETNAAHVVRACATHDDLVAALTKMMKEVHEALPLIERLAGGRNYLMDDLQDASEIADAALAKATAP